MTSSRQRFRSVALASAGPSGSAFFSWTTMIDYGLLAIAEDMERSAALLDQDARPPQSPVVMKGRAAFLIHMAGVLRGWVPHPQHTSVKDDIL